MPASSALWFVLAVSCTWPCPSIATSARVGCVFLTSMVCVPRCRWVLGRLPGGGCTSGKAMGVPWKPDVDMRGVVPTSVRVARGRQCPQTSILTAAYCAGGGHTRLCIRLRNLPEVSRACVNGTPQPTKMALLVYGPRESITQTPNSTPTAVALDAATPRPSPTLRPRTGPLAPPPTHLAATPPT